MTEMTGKQFKRLRKRAGFKHRSDLVVALNNTRTVDCIRKWETGKRKIDQLVVSFLKGKLGEPA